jgi:hypothetical protein
MSTYCYLESTNFTLVGGEDSIPAIEALIEEHLDDYGVGVYCSDQGRQKEFLYALAMDGDDVGDSFCERVGSLVDAMTPLVSDCFTVTVRSDSMGDERDTHFVGGPSREAIDAYEENRRVAAALEILNVHDTYAAREILRLLKNSKTSEAPPVIAPEDVCVFATVEGGVIQGAVATHPIKVFCIDFDADGCDKDQLVDVTMGRHSHGLAEISEIPVDADAHRCVELHRAMTDLATPGAHKNDSRPRRA